MGDGQSVSGLSDFGEPRTWGRYRLASPVCIDTLGEAWVGHVASGRDTGRTVIVTLLDYSIDSLVVRPIVQASRAAMSMRDPNLLAFLDVAPSDEGVALVSEYLDGEPLSTFLSSSAAQGLPVPPGVAFSIVLGATQTLSRLRQEHPTEFAQGALCPETIFVTGFGETMLRHPSLQSAASRVAGFRRHPSSLPYRSPESLLDPRENEESSDVFSMGVILWELLSGQSLFADHLRLGRFKRLPPDQLDGIEQQVLSGKIQSLDRVSRSGGALHSDAVCLVNWCLQRDPAGRPQTLQELGRALSSLPPSLHGESTEVARAVARVAGKTIEHRDQKLLGSRPPRPEASGLISLSQFPTSEETTARGPRQPVVPALASASQLRRIEVPEFAAELNPVDEPVPDSRLDEPHPPAIIAIEEHTRDASSQGGWLFAAVALLAVGVATSLAWMGGSTEGESPLASDSDQRDSDERASKLEKTGLEEANTIKQVNSEETEGGTSAKEAVDSVQVPPPAATPVQSATPVRKVPVPVARPKTVAPPKKGSTPAKKAGPPQLYRPRGI